MLAALQARQRRFEMILVSHGSHVEKFQEVLELAAQIGVPVKMVSREELDAMAHGTSHGGLLAVVSPKPRMSAGKLTERIEQTGQPALLLLLEGVEDARNLGFVLRSADAAWRPCGVDQKAFVGF